MKSSDFAKKPEVFLDMDGVLADFHHGYNQVSDNPVPTHKDIPPPKDDPTFKKLTGSNFFATLPKFNSADALVNMIVQQFGSYSICTSPLRNDHANSEKYKTQWIQQHLNPQPKRIVVTPMKSKFAKLPDGTPNVLIDDRIANVKAWQAAGGIGILYNAHEDSLDVVVRGLQPQQELSENFNSHREHTRQLDHFEAWAIKKLHINGDLPHIEYSARKEKPDQIRTGYYDPDTSKTWIYTGNRNLIDIIRTVAHELAHHKQREDHETYANRDIAEIESQADEAAGMMVKIYVRQFPGIIE
jgi:5'(3')-deoxyribonucleotidase